MTITIKPNPGPQTVFLSTPADIAIYGGGAGGGKSWGLVVEPMRHIHHRGFGGVIFRRTYAQVEQEGGLWDEASEVYPLVGAVGTRNRMTWRFPSGATIRFGHLEHEDSKKNYQGGQIGYLAFDELTHFSESQFFYLVSRNRSKTGIRSYIRATCNPEPGWVAKFLDWWINPVTGFPIPERAGVLRWFYRVSDELCWYDSQAEAEDANPALADKAPPKSVTFIPAKLADNPVLMKADPGYLANLMSLPRVEQARLLGGNWKINGAEIISLADLQRYDAEQNYHVGGTDLNLKDAANVLRFATIDTAGTGREKAEQRRGKEPSWSCVGIWDHERERDNLFLREVWRKQVSFTRLVAGVKDTLDRNNTRIVVIENAHVGPALADSLGSRYQIIMVPTRIKGMAESNRGAKLDRALASGLLTKIESGSIFVPESGSWLQAYLDELEGWDGHPDSQADQIDISSHASWYAKQSGGSWGGVIRN